MPPDSFAVDRDGLVGHDLRFSGASLQSEVIWQTTTDACAAGKASV